MWFGLIICYESSTWAFADTDGKSHKIREFWRSFLGTTFWDIFGMILAPFWDHFGNKMAEKGRKRRSKNRPEKKVQKKACDCSQVSASLGAAVPLKPSNWTAGGSFKHPTVTPLAVSYTHLRAHET